MSESIRQTLTQRLKLEPDADDDAILAGLDTRLGEIADQAVTAEISSGQILAAHRDYWMGAFKANFSGTHDVLASLATPAPAVRAVSARGAAVAGAALVKPKPVRADPPGVQTIEEMNAQINSDPELQRAFWALGVRDGIEKPPETITSGPDFDPAWNPKHQLVVNDDGTGQWVTPPADFGSLGQTTDGG